MISDAVNGCSIACVNYRVGKKASVGYANVETGWKR